MTEILLVGSFHFFEFGTDVGDMKIQTELQSITNKLSKFSPDKICVECATHQQELIDESYSKFSLEDLADANKQRRGNLGIFNIYNQQIPLTYQFEAVQIAYRLGKQLNHKKIYGIDEDIQLDWELIKECPTEYQTDINKLIEETFRKKEEPILEALKYVNSEEWSRINQEFYSNINSLNTKGDYEGTMYLIKWYERNLKIFSNIQNLAKTSKRIFVVYGAGHLQLLRNFINESNNLSLVDVYEYL